jgi:hypothetical protein
MTPVYKLSASSIKGRTNYGSMLAKCFYTITTAGGGGGASAGKVAQEALEDSGGGGGSASANIGWRWNSASASPVQGYDGGNGPSYVDNSGGGGGGAGAVGGNATNALEAWW